MAQTNFTPIQLYHSTTPSAVPDETDLLDGELAINIADKKLYAKDDNGDVFVLASETGSAGTVTDVSVVSANGLAGTVANATTAAAITLSTTVTGVMKGNGTAISAATAGTDYLAPPSGTAIQKANSGGALTNAVAGTDYAPATSGSAILYGNGSGGFSSVAIGSGVTFAGGILSATGTGTVTSVDVSGGTTGLTTSGGPVTGSGTITLSGILEPSNGGTGANTLTGYIKGTGTTPFVASSTVPTTDLSGTVSNAQLANSGITINGIPVSLGGSVTVTAASSSPLTIGTGLSGTSYDGSAPVTIAIDSTVATLTGTQTLTNKSISGSANTLTNIPNSALTNSTISGVSLGSNLPNLTIGTGLSGTSYNGTTATTVSIDSSVVTLTGTQTLTNKTLTAPEILDTIKFTGSGAGSYTPFVQTFASYYTNYNGYQLNYIQNINNGSDASADYVAYNDASDVNSYFIDMGIGSSNYTNPIYTVFPANAGYLYTGGGSSGQSSDLVIGTSNTASDIVFFTGDTLTANIRARIKGTGNFLIGTNTDTGETFQVDGDAYISGATEFGSTVLLSADPTLALEAATKAYVDNAVTAGLHIHEPVRVETTANLTATYVQGGTTFNITDITSGTTVTTSASHGLVVNDQIWLTTTAGNGLSTNTAYFVYSTPAANQLTLSLTFGGSEITGLTNATGLTYATRANSGVGATLTNAGAQAALIVDGVTLSVADRVMVRLQTNGAENGVYVVTNVGSGATNWILTRANDANQVNPNDPDGLGTGDYFFTREGVLNAGDSHVLTTEPNTMIIGYTALTYTQFSGQVDYVGGTNIDITGQTISLTGTVAATNGGTGTSTVTTGDLLYGSATNTWAKLPIGIAYKSLIVNAAGTQMEWNAVPLNQVTAVSGQLGVANGGTGASTLTGYVIGAGTSALTASSTIPVADLTGTLPVTSGGTGQTTYTNGQILIGNAANGLTKATITAGSNISITNGDGTITIAATGGATGTVTSVDVSGGTTGLTTSGGPVTSSGTITLAGTLALANGGTGATTVSGAQTNLQVDPAGTAVAMAIALG
jgi:hypothetical protein